MRGSSPRMTTGSKLTRRGLSREGSGSTMGFKCGIVGLPNVGKSTLFNALTQTAAAQAANYPFCTIEPNIGDVAVPEPRLDRSPRSSARRRSSRRGSTSSTSPAWCAAPRKARASATSSSANIRDCDAIALVARCFDDTDITHVEGRIDPLARPRHHRDRTDAGRPGEPGKARRLTWKEARQDRRRQGSRRHRLARQPPRWRFACRQAGAYRLEKAQDRQGRHQGLADAAAADLQAGALRLQCRGRRRRRGQ